ncbi:MAG TPA: alpha-2-macroglobulin family protein, partial [Opitutaceae bacterium]
LVVEPREEKSRPGIETGVVLRAVDASGKPRQSEIVLGVADEAVRKLAGDFVDSEGSEKFTDFRLIGSIDVTHSGHDRNAELRISTRDPRPGAIRSPRGGSSVDDDIIVLSPFSVESVAERGYMAMNTLAGTRLRTEFADKFELAQLDVRPPPIITRRFFASTAAWMPEIVTDAKGEARVTFKYPDNLTQWHIDAYAVGADGNTFGRASVLTRTSLPLQARIQAPRFLTEGDKADIGVLLLNRTDGPLTADASLAIEGAAAIDRSKRAPKKGVTVPQQGEARISWPVAANETGFAKLTTTSRAGGHGDAMEITLPVLPDGFLQETVASGRLAADAREQVLTLRLPDPLDPAKVSLKLKFAPGHAPALLDALPYLVDYPYGCVEQTMSRFLPALVVRKTLVELGLDEEEVESRIVAKETAADRARREKTAGLLKIDEVAERSLAKLAEAQSYGGSFGWWPGQDAIDPWMTAYVVWGLSISRECGFDAPGDMEEDARGALCRWMESTEETNDVLAWALFAASRSDLETKEVEVAATVFKRVMAQRAKLGAAGRSCLALAAKRWGSAEDRATLLLNLENGATRSQAAGYGETVHWGSASGYWRAMDGAVECTALTLLALLELDPDHRLVEPAAVWLGLNRRSARWSNTRDTALAVLALSELVARSGTLQADATIEVSARGIPAKRLTLDRDALLGDALGFDVPSSALRAGVNEFRVRLVSGNGPVYALGLASAWSRNEGAFAAGHLVGAAREFERRVPQQTVAGTVRFTSESIARDGSARQGEEVYVVVTLDVPNELEYLAVEVPKPAGCEPLNPLSGWDARLVRLDDQPAAEKEKDPGRAIYREEHDDRSVFFLDRVEAGRWEIRFGMRATFAGDYRAAPAKVEAMYAPEIRANTDARRVRIEPANE